MAKTHLTKFGSHGIDAGNFRYQRAVHFLAILREGVLRLPDENRKNIGRMTGRGYPVEKANVSAVI
jgi:hypothetical protein